MHIPLHQTPSGHIAFPFGTYDEVKANVMAAFFRGSPTEWQKSPFMSYVQINFDDPYATIIEQDAKVTFADRVGSIGGTFGVFLGLSFVSLLDEFIDLVQWLRKTMKF